jgi:hypothetical protein
MSALRIFGLAASLALSAAAKADDLPVSVTKQLQACEECRLKEIQGWDALTPAELGKISQALIDQFLSIDDKKTRQAAIGLAEHAAFLARCQEEAALEHDGTFTLELPEEWP